VVWTARILLAKSSILLLVSSILADSDLTISSILLFVSSILLFVLSMRADRLFAISSILLFVSSALVCFIYLVLKSGDPRPHVFQLVHDGAEVEDEDLLRAQLFPSLILPNTCSTAIFNAS
jgi:glucan phosphoethanolaminetransferase (alkaline phosphatase superfamily)